MQLLPQTKIIERKKDERETEIFRRLRVQKAKAKEEKELHDIVSTFDPQKEKLRKEFNSYKDLMEKRKSAVLGEILVLERRRDTAMEPFYELKFQALEAMDKAQEYEDKVKQAAKNVNEERGRLTVLSAQLKEKEVLLSNKEQIIADTEIRSIEREAIITKEEKSFEKEKLEFETYSARIMDELEEKDRDLKAREASVEVKLESIATRETALLDEVKHLESRQQALALAFDEARKKGIL